MHAMTTPADFAEVAVGKTNAEIAEHYGCGITIITRFRKEAGVVANPPSRARTLPDDFAAVAPGMTYAEMEQRWDVGSKLITRWCREVGVVSSGHRSTKPKAAPRCAPPPRRSVHRGGPAPTMATADTSDAGMAASYLRRFYPNVYRMSVHPADELRARNVPDGGRNHFNVGGRGIIAANDLIELARAKGWAA
ncbi:hypothetical protein [Sphingomonas montanisoli]|uniref:Uncharacterized protein n=1 Tax=Sphingomonas montanisoli TaxID=2606412 RepID=A0A5D9C4K0_9SPHN|nr:hypothetical protein [Sphingomonas montanisoli]TZG24885.1 hypothetical protein FYJ91_16520 [Sphingomonas montanisoli]